MKLDDAGLSKLRLFADRCVDCGLCLKGCMMSGELKDGPKNVISRFLRKGAIDDDWAFRCSLCGYCSTVCPAGADLRSVMIALREASCKKPPLRMKKIFAGVLLFQFMATWRYMGTPPVFPKKRGKRLFFPGCAMASSDPELALKTWRALISMDPDMGIMVDCCGTPASSLGRRDVFDRIRGRIEKKLTVWGVEEIIVACPNCLKALSSLPMKVTPVWGYLGNTISDLQALEGKEAMFHAPCPLRGQNRELAEVERLARTLFPSIRTKPYGANGGMCCGAGGMVPIVHPKTFSDWSRRISDYRKDGEIVLCCCQSCVDAMGGRDADVIHLLRVMLGGEAPPPPTGLGRWINRRKLRKAILGKQNWRGSL